VQSSILPDMTAAEVRHLFSYTEWANSRVLEDYSLPLGQQMQHVVKHATLHAGQVVDMIRQLGIVAAVNGPALLIDGDPARVR
jgi:uncharacterized damage-inducible protein DinB